MKFGAMNLPIKPVVDEINALGKLGFDYIELTLDAPEATPDKLLRNKDEIHVSCRGTQYLVSKGLDLGKAMKTASQKLGGHGGGHAIASGATISIEKEEEFLNLVDEIIVKQIMS